MKPSHAGHCWGAGGTDALGSGKWALPGEWATVHPTFLHTKLGGSQGAEPGQGEDTRINTLAVFYLLMEQPCLYFLKFLGQGVQTKTGNSWEALKNK